MLKAQASAGIANERYKAEADLVAAVVVLGRLAEARTAVAWRHVAGYAGHPMEEGCGQVCRGGTTEA